MELSEVVKDA